MLPEIIADVSFYQYSPKGEPLRKIDFQKMAAGGARAVIIRAGQNEWVDPRLNYSWPDSAGVLPRGSYWFYDSRSNPKRQAEMWVMALEGFGDLGELEMWADFEDRYGGPYGRMNHWYDFMERIHALLPGKARGVYTNYYYFSERRDPSFDSYWLKFPLWAATYRDTGPDIPLPWKNWLMWQYTSNGIGANYGVVSKDIDLSYFNGTQADFQARYGINRLNLPVLAVFDGEIVKYKEV